MTEPEPIPVVDGIAVVYGYGVKVRVERGHLFLSDGICADRRASYLNRATSGLRHLVILGHTGSITVDALKWLNGVGAAVSMIDADGEVLFTSGPLGLDNGHLRRAQALAAYTDVGRAVTRALLVAKVAGQARVLREHGHDDAADYLAAAADTLEGATTLDEMRPVERIAADRYWTVWATRPVQFARKHADKVPAHWKMFGARTSGKGGGRQNATTPANALVNYLYAVLEVETRVALLTVGLDPGLGFLHSDTKNRASLALDVLEVARPDVDRWLLDFLARRTFARADFHELPDGICRIGATLARELCATAPLWRALVAPVVEQVASAVLAGHKPDAKLATNLTHARRRDASARRWGGPIARDATDNAGGEVDEEPSAPPASEVAFRVHPPAPRAKLAGSCRECGKPLSGGRSKYCGPACRAAHDRAIQRERYAAARQPNPLPPATAGRAPSKRRQAIADKASDRVAWETAHPEISLAAERQRYAAEILPRLREQDPPLRAIAEGLGVSPGYAAKIRNGSAIPHPMYHARLVELLAADGNE